MKTAKRIILLVIGTLLLITTLCLISSCSGLMDDGKYTASFYADGKLVEKVEFKKGDKVIEVLPSVPKKKGLVGAWESYKLKNKDIRIDAVYAESFTVKIVADDPYAFTFEGETEQTITASNPKMMPVKINANDGYAIDYYEIDGVRYDKVNLIWRNVNADATITVHSKTEIDEIPVICIDTNDKAIKSNVEYTEMSFDLKNCNGKLSGISGGIRLRGNSTLGFPKKAYRVKFDKKQSLFGLEKAKNWVLLAEYIDPSNLHNHAALTIANKMPGLAFTPTPTKVNLYLNGVYQGMYTLCEQVQEDKGRMDIELDVITPSMNKFEDYNWFVSLDLNCPSDPQLVENESYLAFPGYGNEYLDTMYFEIKYPEKDDFPTEKQFEWFIEELKDRIEGLLDDFEAKDADAIKKKTNIHSLIDYVIIDEIMGQEDHDTWHKSFNIYYTHTSKNREENNKINFGPIWDYDWCLNTPWTGKPNEYYEFNDKIEYCGPFYNVAFEIEEFYDTLKLRYNKYAKPALKKYIDGYDKLVEGIEESMQANAEIWYGKYDSELTSKNVKFLKDYLAFRYELLNEAWAK